MGDFITANMLEKVKKKVLFMGKVNKYLSIFDWIWIFCTCSFYGPLTIEMITKITAPNLIHCRC